MTLLQSNRLFHDSLYNKAPSANVPTEFLHTLPLEPNPLKDAINFTFRLTVQIILQLVCACETFALTENVAHFRFKLCTRSVVVGQETPHTVNASICFFDSNLCQQTIVYGRKEGDRERIRIMTCMKGNGNLLRRAPQPKIGSNERLPTYQDCHRQVRIPAEALHHPFHSLLLLAPQWEVLSSRSY